VLDQLPRRAAAAAGGPCQNARLRGRIDDPIEWSDRINVARHADVAVHNLDSEGMQRGAIRLCPDPPQAVEHGDIDARQVCDEPPADRRSDESTTTGDERLHQWPSPPAWARTYHASTI
jgi:hypothetical protein